MPVIFSWAPNIIDNREIISLQFSEAPDGAGNRWWIW